MGVINNLNGWVGISPQNSTPIRVWIVEDPLDFATLTASKEGDIGFSTDGSIYRRVVGTGGWTLVFDPSVGGGGSAWGSITGVLSTQTDLQAALDDKSDTGHTHAEGDVTNLTTDLSGKAAVIHSHSPADLTLGEGTTVQFNGLLISVSQALVAATAGVDYIAGDDPRMTDSRNPLEHSHGAGDITSGVLSWDRLPVLPAFPVLGSSSGEDGMAGPPGTAGAAGANGNDGAAGATGPMGVPGFDGDDGVSGWPGSAGAAGANGAAGSDGAVGATGAAGALGFPGSDGADGMDGWPGVAGVAGAAGANGNDGAAGAAGAAGIAGFPGVNGEDGADGWSIPGPAGATGAPGAGGGDFALSLLAPAVDETVTAGYSAVFARKFTVASGKKLTIGSAARMRIL